MARGLDGFAEEAPEQIRFFERAGVHVYAETLRAIVGLFERDTAVREAVESAWEEREFFASYERSLLLLATLHREVLTDPAFPLAPAFLAGAPVDPSRVARVLTPPSPTLETIRSRLVQTNEVTRSIAWRLVVPDSWANTPVALVDLGCSAGLNLVSDRLPLAWTTEDGAPVALATPGRIVARVGLDRAPIDPSFPQEALWLRACLWPGQTERRARLDAAIEAATIARSRGEIELVTLDAGAMPAWLEHLSTRLPDARVLAYHSVFAEYLVPDARARFELAMKAWLERHEKRAVWVQFETAPRGVPGPVQLSASVAVGGLAEAFVIGSSEYHPKAITIDRARLDALWAGLD